MPDSALKTAPLVTNAVLSLVTSLVVAGRSVVLAYDASAVCAPPEVSNAVLSLVTSLVVVGRSVVLAYDASAVCAPPEVSKAVLSLVISDVEVGNAAKTAPAVTKAALSCVTLVVTEGRFLM